MQLAISTVVIFIIFHILVYAIPPILGSITAENEQITLNYAYLGVLFALVQLFDNLYTIQLPNGTFLNGGDIAYSALIFATFYLITSQPEPRVIRNLIHIFFFIAIFLFLLFATIAAVLKTGFVINNLEISAAFLEFSLRSLLFSLSLFSSEIIITLAFIRKITTKYTSVTAISISIVICFNVVLLIDGILYPIGINLLFPGAELTITNGISAKLIFGLGFGIVLFILLILRPRNLSEIVSNDVPFIRYLIPPSKELKEQLAQAEEAINQLAKVIPICASCKMIRDDDGYWDQLEIFMKKHSDLTFSHGLCPNCAQKMLDDID